MPGPAGINLHHRRGHAILTLERERTKTGCKKYNARMNLYWFRQEGTTLPSESRGGQARKLRHDVVIGFLNSFFGPQRVGWGVRGPPKIMGIIVFHRFYNTFGAERGNVKINHIGWNLNFLLAAQGVRGPHKSWSVGSKGNVKGIWKTFNFLILLNS